MANIDSEIDFDMANLVLSRCGHGRWLSWGHFALRRSAAHANTPIRSRGFRAIVDRGKGGSSGGGALSWQDGKNLAWRKSLSL